MHRRGRLKSLVFVLPILKQDLVCCDILVGCWLGVDFVMLEDISQLGALTRGTKLKAIRHIFWHSTCWNIWGLINSIIFRQGQQEERDILSHIKACSRKWLLYKKGVKAAFSFPHGAQTLWVACHRIVILT